MATTLTVNSVGASINWNLAFTPIGLGTITAPGAMSYSIGLGQGTGAAGTANLIYAAQVVLAASANTTLTLSSGLSDVFGNSLVFARAKFVYIHNTALTTASSITVGNATHPLPLFSAGTATISINNNGIFLVGDPGATGIAVGSGATDAIKIVNADGSNSATVNVCLVGSTA